jgi:SulP family sulfate permease
MNFIHLFMITPMLCTALRKTLRTYTLHTFKHDALAALVVSLVALPLSMALSIAVGLPPQHGLYTAIIAGIVAPLLGGSNTQVSGPTAAFIVILSPIVSEHGLRGLIWCGIIAGFILIGLGISKLGKMINYIPYPVTTGFTAGIAVVLGFLSLNDFAGLGLKLPTEGFIDKASVILFHLDRIDIPTLSVGVLTLMLLIHAGKFIKHIPTPIIAVGAATALTWFLQQHGYAIDTIGARFHYTDQSTGAVIAGIPPYLPVLHLPSFNAEDSLFVLPSLDEFRALLFPAFTVAILAALESLLSATVADSMTGTRHDPNAEVNAIGIANILTSLGAGIPATGAIARTATAINNGAKTPISCVLHAVFIAIYMLLLAPYIAYVPMASLAAILIYTAYRMSHWRQCVHIVEIGQRSDVIVLLCCFSLTVFIDMVAGVSMGLLCASFLLMKQITELTSVELEVFDDNAEKDERTIRQAPKDTLIYRIQGPLFFGTIEKAFDSNRFTHEHINHLILDMRYVPFIDMTGLVAINSLLASTAHEHCRVSIISNAPAVSFQITRSLLNSPFRDSVGFYDTIETALYLND